MACIYKLVNVANDFFYIGSARNARRRKWEHLSDLKKGVHHCVKLQQAWDEFGADAFEFEILEEVDDAKVLQIEDMYLQLHAGQDYCYNTATSTTQPPSYTDEARAKISESLKTYYRDGGVPSQRGKHHSAETRAKISANRVGKMAGAKHYRYGKTVSAEVREKIGAAQRGVKKAPRVYTEAGREKFRAAAAAGHYSHSKGKKMSADFVAKIRRRVVAVDTRGQVHEYDSILLLRTDLGIPPGTVNNALKSGLPLEKGPYTGWRFSYAGKALIALPAGPTIPAEFASYPRSRPEAKRLGVARYFTGVPCVNGHIALRKTKGVCTECSKQQDKEHNARRKQTP